MVSLAEQYTVVEIGGPTVRPLNNMVGMASTDVHSTVRVGAMSIAYLECPAQSWWDGPMLAAYPEHPPGFAQESGSEGS